jgi:hypothetical protein
MPLRFPMRGGGEWALEESQLEIWRTLYPGVDVDREVRKAWAWLDANPSRKKKNPKAFLVNWLKKCAPRSPVGLKLSWALTDGHADIYGHVPPCRTWQECTRRALAEARRS